MNMIVSFRWNQPPRHQRHAGVVQRKRPSGRRADGNTTGDGQERSRRDVSGRYRARQADQSEAAGFVQALTNRDGDGKSP